MHEEINQTGIYHIILLIKYSSHTERLFSPSPSRSPHPISAKHYDIWSRSRFLNIVSDGETVCLLGIPSVEAQERFYVPSPSHLHRVHMFPPRSLHCRRDIDRTHRARHLHTPTLAK